MGLVAVHPGWRVDIHILVHVPFVPQPLLVVKSLDLEVWLEPEKAVGEVFLGILLRFRWLCLALERAKINWKGTFSLEFSDISYVSSALRLGLHQVSGKEKVRIAMRWARVTAFLLLHLDLMSWDTVIKPPRFNHFIWVWMHSSRSMMAKVKAGLVSGSVIHAFCNSVSLIFVHDVVAVEVLRVCKVKLPSSHHWISGLVLFNLACTRTLWFLNHRLWRFLGSWLHELFQMPDRLAL